MNSFTQNMLSFQKYLNNPDGQDNNNWATTELKAVYFLFWYSYSI
jgi:hypothetical protein